MVTICWSEVTLDLEKDIENEVLLQSSLDCEFSMPPATCFFLENRKTCSLLDHQTEIVVVSKPLAKKMKLLYILSVVLLSNLLIKKEGKKNNDLK